MANIESFERHANAYETWFNENIVMYAEELHLLKELVHGRSNSMEIGMGTGRFAQPLGITIGIEPSEAMRRIAQAKGLNPIDAIAESLPFTDECFDCVLMITVLCFVDDPLQALREAYRVLSYNGSLIIGIINKETSMGQMYQKEKEKSRFYSDAVFYSLNKVYDLAQQAGFSKCTARSVPLTNDGFVFIECFKLKTKEIE